MKVEDFDKFKKKGRPKVWKTDDPLCFFDRRKSYERLIAIISKTVAQQVKQKKGPTEWDKAGPWRKSMFSLV